MAPIYRPHIPVETQCRVALRQLGIMFPDVQLEANKPAGKFIGRLKLLLATKFNCDVTDLRLDHDPPLAARPRFRRGLGRTRYEPDANDQAHLIYRPHGPEFVGSHLIKTNVRGDHGQHPDRVLIKKERARRNKTRNKKRKVRRASVSRPKLRTQKRKWLSKPWPKGRKIKNRGFR